MANIYYTDNAAKENAVMTGDRPPFRSRSGDSGYRSPESQYVYCGSAACGRDQIRICRLPAGVTVAPHLCKITTEALGTAFTVDIGTESASDRWGKTIDLKAAGDVDVKGGSEGVAVAALNQGEWVIATVTAVTAPTNGKKALFRIGFTVH